MTKVSFERMQELCELAASGAWEALRDAVEREPSLATAHDEINRSLLYCLSGFAGSSEVLEYLLDCGADVNDKPFAGGSALAHAILGGSNYGLTTLPELKLLLDRGANLAADAENGYPALHWAILNHRPEHARLLLDYGADPFQRTFLEDQETAFDVARRSRSEASKRLLLEWCKGRNVAPPDSFSATQSSG